MPQGMDNLDNLGEPLNLGPIPPALADEIRSMAAMEMTTPEDIVLTAVRRHREHLSAIREGYAGPIYERSIPFSEQSWMARVGLAPARQRFTLKESTTDKPTTTD